MTREDSAVRDVSSAQQNEHLPFLISKIEANDEPEHADREKAIGLCTRGPLRPDICFRNRCGWSMGLCTLCVCVSGDTDAR